MKNNNNEKYDGIFAEADAIEKTLIETEEESFLNEKQEYIERLINDLNVRLFEFQKSLTTKYLSSLSNNEREKIMSASEKFRINFEKLLKKLKVRNIIKKALKKAKAKIEIEFVKGQVEYEKNKVDFERTKRKDKKE